MRPISRRSVLGKTLAGVAVAAMPRIAAGESPNEKVVLGLIGAGGRGSMITEMFSKIPNVEIKYVSDVDGSRGTKLMAAMEKNGAKTPKRVVDMREVFDDKDVHGVIVATADHWHALATVWACQAGKDVYVEKNISKSIWEGRKMVEAARKYKRVVQGGFQNRSGPYAYSAREYIKSGKLGKIAYVNVYNMLRFSPWKAQADSQAPANLDWDKWIGPAPMVPYNAGRHRGWYYWYDYCNGDLSNDGSHQLDLLRLVLGNPAPPVRASCAGGNFAWGSERNTPELQAATFEYPEYVVQCTSTAFAKYLRKSTEEERSGSKGPVWPQNCERIEIYGSDQMMYLGRQGVGWQVFEADGKLVAQDKGHNPDELHQKNFVECIRTRKSPNADIEQVFQSSLLPHMANISYRTGKGQVVFDAKTETFVNNDAANKLLKAAMRSPYVVPEMV